ncbi:tetratricopeptide repeat protein [Spirosoma sp. BT702]|uniref:histidine kinase n=1 Tax=Spirosoma profusum TaxID=2771354 RepID=A0A927AMZ4_9BACT|nr:tetratricopeptide repeat protein [Spirosoma profusum]MBD2700799.1 tetratricopeptide repeat protein [Spirosoma profusum]
MRLNFYVISLISCLLVGAESKVIGQTKTSQQVDSLASQVKKLQSAGKTGDTTYARTVADYAYYLYVSGASKQADSIARQSEQLARNLNFGPGVARSMVTQGGAQMQLNHSENTLRIFQQLIRDIERYKLPKLTLCRTLANLGMVYRHRGQLKEALDVTMQAIQIETRYTIRPRSESLRATLGYLFRQTGEIDKGIAYVREGIAIAQENEDLIQQAPLEVDLGALYNEKEQYKQSIVAYGDALTHSRQTGYEHTQVDALNGLALNHSALGHAQQALAFGKQALALAKRLDYTHNTANAHYTLGEVYMKQKQYVAADAELHQAFLLAQESGSLANQVLFVGERAVVAALRNDYRNAYIYKIQEQKLRDSVMTDEQKTRTDELVARYEAEKKEARIKLLNQQAQLRDKELAVKRWQTNALLVGGLLIVLLGGAVSAWLLNRARLRRLEEAQNLRKQIAHDLHDEVGSTLSSISMLSSHTDTLLSQNRPESAQKIVQKIYSDARQILESVDEIIWTINPGNDSLHRIALRLREYAQPLMESKGIDLQFVADTSLDQIPVSMEVRRNLYLIGKEAINNLVKYSQATQAVLRFERKEDRLHVLIEDNGRGFVQESFSTRNGQTSMKQRAEAMGGSLEVHSVPEQGTRLVLTTLLA